MSERDYFADKEFNVVIGADRIVRINVDGMCVLRIRMEKDCVVKIDDRQSLPEETTI